MKPLIILSLKRIKINNNNINYEEDEFKYILEKKFVDILSEIMLLKKLNWKI